MRIWRQQSRIRLSLLATFKLPSGPEGGASQKIKSGR
jgi:hypothetical protein